MTGERLTIGTRGSDLALWQAHEAARLLPAPTAIKIIKTSGDRFQQIALQGQLEQGFFTKEIESQLLAGGIDLAVHSLKDLPTQLAPGLALGAHLKRAPVSDLLVIHPQWHDAAHLLPVRAGCQVGAMSLRRQALLRTCGPHARAVEIRGNVPSRISRCADQTFGAIILARAGVERLGLDLTGLHVYELNPEHWLPAPGQGAVAIEARAGDERVLALLAGIDDQPTRQAVELERRLLANFEGGCHTAFGAWATVAKDVWSLRVGLEADGAWRQTAARGSWRELEPLGPRSALEFAPLPVMEQEELCRPLQW